MKTLNEKLSESLTEKGIKFTDGQVEYVCNYTHEINPLNLPFNQVMCPYIPLMVDTFLMLSNLSKFESDFRNL